MGVPLSLCKTPLLDNLAFINFDLTAMKGYGKQRQFKMMLTARPIFVKLKREIGTKHSQMDSTTMQSKDFDDLKYMLLKMQTGNMPRSHSEGTQEIHADEIEPSEYRETPEMPIHPIYMADKKEVDSNASLSEETYQWMISLLPLNVSGSKVFLSLPKCTPSHWFYNGAVEDYCAVETASRHAIKATETEGRMTRAQIITTLVVKALEQQTVQTPVTTTESSTEPKDCKARKRKNRWRSEILCQGK